MSPSTLAVIASALVLVGYAAIGYFQRRFDHTPLSFFLNERSLGTREVRNTFAGAAISISTVLVFFFTIGLQFGWQILLSPITLALGVLLFRHLVHPQLLKRRLVQISPEETSSLQIDSLSDVIRSLYGSRLVSVTITAISALGILAILVAELMVGVTVLQVAHIHPTLALFAIALVVLFYAGLGGMRSVVVTDRWQVILIVSALSLVLLGMLTKVSENVPNFLGDFLTAGWEPKFPLPAALIANITIVNLCLLPASLRVWQVVAAAKSGQTFRRGLWESTALIIFTSLCALMIGKSMIALLGPAEGEFTTDQLFKYLESAGGVVSYVFYPLFVVAMLSALISTADSAVLPLAQSLHATRSAKFNYALNLTIIASLLGVSIGAYFFVTRILNMGVVNWILTVFSITTIIAPAIVIPLFGAQKSLTKTGGVILSVGLLIACAAALTWSAKHSDDISTQPWNCAIGVAIATAATAISLFFFSTSKTT